MSIQIVGESIELCDKYKGLSKKEKVHTERMIHTMFDGEAGFKVVERGFDSKHYRVDVLNVPI